MRFLTLALAALLSSAAFADALPTNDELQRDGAIIGEITLHKSNVFDLLIKRGDSFSARKIDESERILRRNLYLFDASISPVRHADGVVDLEVRTRDVWTLNPDISVSRSGGENRTKIGLEETNLLGRGQLVRIARVENVDRTSDSFEFFDRHLGRSWVSALLQISDNSDGKRNQLSAVRPFYALDTRWSAGGWFLEDDRREALYALGEEAAEYRHERDYQSLFGGWSGGLQDGWVRRWTAGVVRDDNRYFTAIDPTLPAAIPQDRDLVYAFLGLEVIEDQYEKTSNRDQIGKTEDFLLGSRFSASIGWSDTAIGADRDALIFSTRFSRGFGTLEDRALLLSLSADGRVESGNAVNSLLGINARYYRKQSEKHLFFATLNATAGHSLDLDNRVEIGGDQGLRGYPLRYQSGDSRMLLSIEQRFFTDWYPFRLVRIGGAIFADAGRVWGEDPLDGRRFNWLSDVGFGLRFAPTRSSARKMIHLDIAFPLGGDDSIDTVQFLLESKRSF